MSRIPYPSRLDFDICGSPKLPIFDIDPYGQWQG